MGVLSGRRRRRQPEVLVVVVVAVPGTQEHSKLVALLLHEVCVLRAPECACVLLPHGARVYIERVQRVPSRRSQPSPAVETVWRAAGTASRHPTCNTATTASVHQPDDLRSTSRCPALVFCLDCMHTGLAPPPPPRSTDHRRAGRDGPRDRGLAQVTSCSCLCRAGSRCD